MATPNETTRASPFADRLTRHGGWLILVASYVLSWALWMPLLARELENVATLPADFLVFALLGNVMPGLAVLAWHLLGARVQSAARLAIGLAWSLVAALLVGLAWGFWHLPADWIGLKSQGAWFWPQFLLQGPVLLTAHSVVMTWIWAASGGRTIVAILYHFGITGSAILLGNQVVFADARFSFLGNLAGVAVVACVAVAAGFGLARRDRAARAVAVPHRNP